MNKKNTLQILVVLMLLQLSINTLKAQDYG